MIPTMILAGLIAGALPRPWHWAGLVAAIVAWPLLLTVSGVIQTTDLESIFGALVLAAVNAAISFWVMCSVVKIVRAVGADRRG